MCVLCNPDPTVFITHIASSQVEFLTLAPGTKLKPHCGTTNRRLTLHLGVIVPEGPYMRVGNETRRWIEGKAVVFDDSFEHEVTRSVPITMWNVFAGISFMCFFFS